MIEKKPQNSFITDVTPTALGIVLQYFFLQRCHAYGARFAYVRFTCYKDVAPKALLFSPQTFAP